MLRLDQRSVSATLLLRLLPVGILPLRLLLQLSPGEGCEFALDQSLSSKSKVTSTSKHCQQGIVRLLKQR